ncbi:MAG: GxxExxY protein [Chitinophagaceae bacterium]|nr:GxxExxY protein [Chitinophagaceae bacterium]
MANNYIHSATTSLIIKSFYTVYNHLGYGFLEKVYQNALCIELRKLGLECIANNPIDVYYDDQRVGLYIADIIVNGVVIIENKAAESLCSKHEAQLLNYLKATNIDVGLLLNFGEKPEFKRKVFSSKYKNLTYHNNLDNLRSKK